MCPKSVFWSHVLTYKNQSCVEHPGQKTGSDITNSLNVIVASDMYYEGTLSQYTEIEITPPSAGKSYVVKQS